MCGLEEYIHNFTYWDVFLKMGRRRRVMKNESRIWFGRRCCPPRDQVRHQISRSRDKKMTRMVMMLGSGWWPSWPLKPGGNTAAAAATAADRTLRAHPGIRRGGRSTMRTSGWFRSCTVPGCPCAWAWRPPLPGPCPGSRCPCTGLPQLEFRNDAVCLGIGRDWEGREISWNTMVFTECSVANRVTKK